MKNKVIIKYPNKTTVISEASQALTKKLISKELKENRDQVEWITVNGVRQDLDG